MRSAIRDARGILALLMLAAVLAGCAEGPGGSILQGRGIDAERLNNAIVADDVGYVRALVEARRISVDQYIPAPGYAEGTPLITLAGKAASLGVLRYLIQAGANVNAHTPAAETALMLASYFSGTPGGRSPREHENAVQMLIDAGASVENLPHHYTPLAYAAYQGHDRIVQFLLARGARVNGDAENNQVYVNTALMMAAIQGHQRTVMLLLKAGADPRIRVKDGMNAAELARKHNHLHIAQMLNCMERHGAAHGGMQSC